MGFSQLQLSLGGRCVAHVVARFSRQSPRSLTTVLHVSEHMMQAQISGLPRVSDVLLLVIGVRLS